MKQIILLITSSLFVLAGCEKAATEENSIVQSWLWVKSTGGISGTTKYPGDDIRRILTFKNDNTFTYTENDAIFKNGIYSTGTVTDITTNQQEPAVTFNPDSGSPLNHPQIIFFEDGNLRLKENCVDCYTHYFVPVK
jgi:hypothetical protein